MSSSKDHYEKHLTTTWDDTLSRVWTVPKESKMDDTHDKLHLAITQLYAALKVAAAMAPKHSVVETSAYLDQAVADATELLFPKPEEPTT